MTAAKNGPKTVPGFIGLPVLALLALLSIPYAFVHTGCILWREWRFRRHLAMAGRTMVWSDVDRELRAGRGTLIIEQAQKEALRLWWCAEDISALTPHPIPAFDELQDEGHFMFQTSPPPFVNWCFERFLHPAKGTACLTRGWRKALPAGFVPPHFFAAQYPEARIVASVLRRSAGPGERSRAS